MGSQTALDSMSHVGIGRGDDFDLPFCGDLGSTSMLPCCSPARKSWQDERASFCNVTQLEREGSVIDERRRRFGLRIKTQSFEWTTFFYVYERLHERPDY